MSGLAWIRDLFPNAYHVARREYLIRVHSRTFAILTVAIAIVGLALTLLPHALERLAHQGGFTLHVESAGADDHHIAEAAFKALGRALGEACARDGGGVRSTKGAA